jgi:pteridine reductase
MNLKDKVVILTGAARVGKAVARRLQAEGAHLAMTYLMDPAEADFPEQGATRKISIQANLSEREDVERVVEKTMQEFGRIDVLVHMAAIYPKTPWEKMSERDWDRNMNIIGKSTFLLAKAAADHMLKNEGEPVIQEGAEAGRVKGKIITITDWSVLTQPYKDYLPYNAAKAAVLGLTKSFAKELAPEVLVNAVAPGPIMRPPDLDDEENTEALSGTPLRRWGGADEIAKAVMYLLDADFVTGHELIVDGGRTID